MLAEQTRDHRERLSPVTGPDLIEARLDKALKRMVGIMDTYSRQSVADSNGCPAAQSKWRPNLTWGAHDAQQTSPRWLMDALGPAALALLAGGSWFYRTQERALRREAAANLTAIAQLKVDQIVQWRSGRLANAAVLTESPFFIAGVEVLPVLGAVPDSPWFLVAKVDAAEALSVLRRESTLILALLLGLVLTAAVALAAVWQRNAKAQSRDQTEARQRLVALLEIQEERAFLADLIQQSSQPLGVGYSNGRLGTVNPAFCRLVGYSQDELRSIDWARVLTPPEWIESERRYLEDLHLTDQPVRYEKEYVRRDGTRVPVELLVHLVRDENGQPQYYYAFVVDITERKQAEEEIRKLNAELEPRVEERTRQLGEAQERRVRQEGLAVLGHPAGGVGHELRDPLGSISNAVYFLMLVLPDAGAKIAESLGIIDNETRNAVKIVADLLDFARIKSVGREPVSVAGLAARTLGRFPAPEGIGVTLNFPETLPTLHVDLRQMTQVLGNLVVKACQAIPQRGRLTLSAVERDDQVAIAVADTGVGIAPENMARLFEPPFTFKSEGIGLGLAVSRRLVEASGGRIEVQSEPVVGSVFTEYLPTEGSP